ncbi:MAG: SUF system Fe-S cluster assembly protein [Bacteroidales bacterium]|nr:SUF system Fe-S cluster assembly protein [Bacteroidales bacterium]
MDNLKDKIIEVLKNIYDPEIPVNIYDLGLIYDIQIGDEGNVKLLMTLTAPNCPIAESLPNQIRRAVMQIEGVQDVWVELTFDPPWTPEKMSDEARMILNLDI